MAKRYEIELKFSSPGAKKLRQALDSLAAAQNRLAKKQSKLNVQSKMAENVTQKMIQSQEKHRVALSKSRVQIVQLQKRIEQLNLKNKLLKQRIDKTTGSFGRLRLATAGLQRRLGAIRNTMLLFTFAFGAALNAVRGFIQTSMQFEAVKVRLNAMFGSVERGTAAFETFNEVAATTPFTLTDVVEAGAALKAFGTNAEEMIKPTADLAAFMGVTATEAAQALGRAFAGGAGAADILRERGILQLVRDFKGIEDLSKLTLPEFRQALTDTLLDPASGIAGATDALSKTMIGMTSNLADAVTRMGAGIGDLINFRGAIQGMTSFFSSFANFLTEVNKTNVDKIKELNKALGIEIPDDTLKKSKEALEIRQKQLELILDPTTNLTKASSDLNKALEDELELREFLESFGKKTAMRDKDGVMRTKGAVIAEVSRAEARRKALQIQVDGFKELDAIQQKLVITNLNLDVANRDAVESFASGLQLLNDIADKEPLDLGLSFRMPETGIQAFADDIADKVASVDKDKLNRAFESLLEFETLFQNQLVNGFMNSFNQIIALQKSNLDQRINNEIKALKKTDKFRNASIEQRQTMEDDIRAKFADEQKRIFKLQKAMQISKVVIDTAAAINQLMQTALASKLIDPTAVIRAKAISIAMGAVSAAQIATISQQQAPAFARGGSFVTQGKQMIMVGDNSGGRERVDITPLSTPDFADAGGGASINVNIMGNVIGTQEFVRDNLLPEIENSIRRNLA
tara:strand:+ start:336 stop:2573 length:2238 start_codon:yes stop_codon:yes gene_type:complete